MTAVKSEPHFSRKGIIDLIISDATNGRFTGDKRDSDAPLITLQNFYDEMLRYGAKELRARLLRLSLAEFLGESIAAFEHIEARDQRLPAYIAEGEQLQREEARRALRQAMAEFGRRHGLQSAILAAARHYRGLKNMTAKRAWHGIKQIPFETSDGETVVIEGSGDNEIMRVKSPQGSQRGGIKQPQWQKRYWPAAKG